MAISETVRNAQRITKAIQFSFVKGELDELPELVQEHRQVIAELAMSGDFVGLHANPGISLHEVGKRLLNMRSHDGLGILNHNVDAKYLSAIIATLPIDIEMADFLVRIPACPIDKLCEKLIQTQYAYNIDMAENRFLQALVEKDQALADRVMVDILDEKSQIDSGRDTLSLGGFIRLATTLKSPSTRLLGLIKSRSPEIINRIERYDVIANLRSLAETIKLPLSAFVALKQGGCDDLINIIMQADGMDFKATDPMDIFFKVGGVLPDAFLKKALEADKFTYSMNLAFLEVLVKPAPDAFKAVARISQFLTPTTGGSHNAMAERWFKTLGDSIEIAVRLGYKQDKGVIVGLIEAVAENITNPVILKGSTLASGIDGRYLASSPSLKAFKGEYVHQELGL
jgi:hypothetical protein